MSDPPANAETVRCETCGKLDDEHAFAEIIACTYGLPEEDGRAVAQRTLDRLADQNDGPSKGAEDG